MTFHSMMMRYALGLFSAIKAYCDWAESEARSQRDLLLLAALPMLGLCLFLWLMPSWVSHLVALALLAPVFYIGSLLAWDHLQPCVGNWIRRK
jgi:hypothetical protein